jgi:hypothetical protein
MSNLVHMMRFWNNRHQVHSQSKVGVLLSCGKHSMTALFFSKIGSFRPRNWVNPPLLVEVSVPSQEQVVMYRYMWINVIGFTFCSTISLSSLSLITCLECPNLSYVAVRLHLSSVSMCCLYRTMKNCTYYYVSLLTAFCNFCLSLVGVFI